MYILKTGKDIQWKMLAHLAIHLEQDELIINKI